MEKGAEAQYRKMTEKPVRRLILTLSIPTVISMMVTSVYNIADTYFVSKLGTSASGAVGVVFSLMAIIQAVGFTVGMGSGSIISRMLGEKRDDDAARIASSGLFMGLALGAVITLFGMLKITDLMMIFGATDTILPYAKSYATYIIFGAPVMIGSFILNNILRSQGHAKYAMWGIASGGILNVVLDPVLIFGFDMGMAGAAIATLTSQCVGFVILLYSFISGKSQTKLSFRKISLNIMDYLGILKAGLPSFSRQGLASISTMFLNRSARIYGDAAVAAMGIVGKIFMIIFSVLIGIGQGAQPVIGYNYGAKNYKRVKKAIVFTWQVGTVLLTVLGAVAFFMSEELVTQFIKGDYKVLEIGKRALMAYSLVLPIMPINMVCNITYQIIGRSWRATLLSCARQGIFFLPLIWTLPKMWGIFGVQIAQPVADVLTALFSIPFGYAFLKELNENIAKEKDEQKSI
ncbi:MAG: MATE family efflux transporter [Ruminococcaceae bacterium]|nr:MATE family efflux transporter [Oscillospiraceae bacterium]